MMRKTANQETDRYYEPQISKSTTNDIVNLVGYAITQQMKGDTDYAQHILDQLINAFPDRAQAIRLTAANMLTERITNAAATKERS